jgi:hypothetical protein
MVREMGLADPFVYGARVSIVFGWLSVWALEHDSLTAVQSRQIERVLVREFPARRIAGEVDWPFTLVLVLYLNRVWLQHDAENVLLQHVNVILNANRGESAAGIPNPYWLHDKVLRLAGGMLAPYEREHFEGNSYTIQQALDALVRRLRRQAVRSLWPEASKLDFCDYRPDHLADYFLWSTDTGNLASGHPPPTVSWSAWRATVEELDRASVPRTLLTNPEWTLPFLLAYPHRANRVLSALAEMRVGRRVRLRED